MSAAVLGGRKMWAKLTHIHIYTAEIWGAALMEWVCRLNEGRDDLDGA